MGKFTSEEIQIAKAVDLVDLAEQVGIPLKRKGRFYQAVGMDSVMIFNRSSWCRFSQGVGGSTIDFLEYFKSMDFVEAVKYLLEFSGYIRTGTMQKAQQERQPGKPEETKQKKESPKEPFVLPPKSETSRRLYGYLMKQRKLSKKVIDFWIKKGLLYESGNYHNLVFVGKDPEGVPRFASQRGTLDKYGKPFKGDVPGNDKTYGVNLVNTHSDTLHVYEAAIDAMSDMELRGDCQTNILVLGMLSDGPLEKFLKDQGVDSLIFMGNNFPNCPRTSIYEASERDFKLGLVTDAMSRVYEQGIEELENIGVTMLTAARTVADLKEIL